MRRIAVIAVSDLMFQPRVRAAAEAHRLEARVADSPEAFERALTDGATLVVVDLNDLRLAPLEAVAAAKAAGARVLAFGRHTDVEGLRAARAAGADAVVPRSQLVEELPSLIAGLVGADTETEHR